MNKHILRTFAWTSLLAGILLGSCTTKSTVLKTGEAGFTIAYFSSTELNAALRDPECVLVRFYNARRTASDPTGSVIMIGIRADGTELNHSSTYKLFDRLTSGMVASISLMMADAHTCCMYVTAPQKRFCAEFPREEVVKILAAKDCGGVQLIPKKTTTDYWSMEMSPVKFSGTTATVLTSVHPAFCSEPCPDRCGPMINYINY